MAWTAIDNSLVSVGALPFATTIQALRDNPIAIANGDSGAPRNADASLSTTVTAAGSTWVGNRTAGLSAGAIGTYVFARSTTASDVAFGSTRAGSVLLPTSAVRNLQASSLTSDWAVNFADGSSLSGTWRCMGFYDYSAAFSSGGSSLTIFGATLWLRIS